MRALEPRVALVTGSSRGIGAAIARRFATEGAKVAVHGGDMAALSEVRAGIERAGGQATQVTADVTRLNEIEACAVRSSRRSGPSTSLSPTPGAASPSRVRSRRPARKGGGRQS